MECPGCYAYVEYRGLCADCRRLENGQEHSRIQQSINEDFQRRLAHDQQSAQRKALQEQAQDLDFREARRLVLALEMEALDNLALASGKARAFFASGLYREHGSRLTATIRDSPFLLTCCARHAIEMLNQREALTEEDIDWECDRKNYLYDKIIELVETESEELNLKPEFLIKIRSYHARRVEEARQKAERQQRFQEEFERGYAEMNQYASSPAPLILPPVPTKPPARNWFLRLWEIMPGQRAKRRKLENERWLRLSPINEIVSAVIQAMTELSEHPKRHTFKQARYILAELWVDDRFDHRLSILVIGCLERDQWLDIGASVAQAFDEFERMKCQAAVGPTVIAPSTNEAC